MTAYSLFLQANKGESVSSDANPYTLGLQFSVSKTVFLWVSAALAAIITKNTGSSSGFNNIFL